MAKIKNKTSNKYTNRTQDQDTSMECDGTCNTNIWIANKNLNSETIWQTGTFRI